MRGIRNSRRRLLAAVVLGLCLALAAGCLGVLPSGSGADADADAPEADGTAATADAAASLENETTPPYDAVPSGEAVVETHRDRLREAGSATISVETDVAVTGPDRNVTDRTSRTATVDYATAPPRQHVVDADGTERWLGSERNLTRRTNGRYARTGGNIGAVEGVAADADTIDAFEFDGPAPTERGGESAEYYRYEANGTDALSADARADLENGTVERVSVELVVRGDGLIVAYEFAAAGTEDDLAYEQRRSVRYDDVGTTDATRPDWYDEALAATDPLPTETVTETRSVPAANATLEVTGEAGDVADRYAVHPTMEERGTYSADELELAQVSCLVYVYLPDDFERAELTVEYEDEHVPGGEDGLAFVRYDQYTGSYTTVGDVDPATNSATASIDEDGYYFVRHEPTYESVFVSGEEPSETAPPPC